MGCNCVFIFVCISVYISVADAKVIICTIEWRLYFPNYSLVNHTTVSFIWFYLYRLQSNWNWVFDWGLIIVINHRQSALLWGENCTLIAINTRTGNMLAADRFATGVKQGKVGQILTVHFLWFRLSMGHSSHIWLIISRLKDNFCDWLVFFPIIIHQSKFNIRGPFY